MIIKSPLASEPERAQIAVEGAGHPYMQIRIENTLTDENGEEVRLKPGAKVKVTVRSRTAGYPRVICTREPSSPAAQKSRLRIAPAALSLLFV
jgi:archaellum component FlaG (FlaF/FlaG flagellin family)